MGVGGYSACDGCKMTYNVINEATGHGARCPLYDNAEVWCSSDASCDAPANTPTKENMSLKKVHGIRNLKVRTAYDSPSRVARQEAKLTESRNRNNLLELRKECAWLCHDKIGDVSGYWNLQFPIGKNLEDKFKCFCYAGDYIEDVALQNDTVNGYAGSLKEYNFAILVVVKDN